MKKLLEVFCGTKSIGKVFEKNGWEVISIDINEKYKPTIVIDILEWDYKIYDKKYFNHIHFSPPCIYMSQLQKCWYGRYKGYGKNKYLYTKEIHMKEMEESDKILYKIKEIIEYFENITFTIENPYHNFWNNISKRNILDYQYEIVNYCMYDYPTKKPTIIYNNFNLKLKKCDKSHNHIIWKKYSSKSKLEDRYMIPEKLVESIFAQIFFLNI